MQERFNKIESLYESFEKVAGGHFVHFFVPENLPSMPKHVIFVLDSSRYNWIGMKRKKIEAIFKVDERSEAEPAEGRHVLNPKGHEGGGHYWIIIIQSYNYDDIN